MTCLQLPRLQASHVPPPLGPQTSQPEPRPHSVGLTGTGVLVLGLGLPFLLEADLQGQDPEVTGLVEGYMCNNGHSVSSAVWPWSQCPWACPGSRDEEVSSPIGQGVAWSQCQQRPQDGVAEAQAQGRSGPRSPGERCPERVLRRVRFGSRDSGGLRGWRWWKFEPNLHLCRM